MVLFIESSLVEKAKPNPFISYESVIICQSFVVKVMYISWVFTKSFHIKKCDVILRQGYYVIL